jgi:nucleoside 2-deoxyribosyltransferase
MEVVMKCYLAAPFFKPHEKALVEMMEQEIEAAGFELLSPRRSGVLLDMSPAHRAESARKIFEQNVRDIEDCDVMVAVIDDRDPGTMWEMGFCHGLGMRQIFTYTEHDYAINIMLKGCVTGHARGQLELGIMLRAIWEGGDLRKFSPDMEKTF